MKIKQLRNIKFHPQVYSQDLPRIEKKLGEEGLLTFNDYLIKEFNLLHKEPVKNTAPLKKRPLSLHNYRKVKFHYKKLKKDEKPAMRIIYRYVKDTDTLEIFAIGFRRDEPYDIYDIADLRENKDMINL